MPRARQPEPKPDIEAIIDGLRARRFDASKLLNKPKTRLDILLEGVQARSLLGSRLTPEERFEAFSRIGFKPYGLFKPDDKRLWQKTQVKLEEIAKLRAKDARNRAYWALQEESQKQYRRGVPGRWTGQMEMAHSAARFIIAAKGRRAGKPLSVHTDIPTPSGWRKMADIQVGDFVFDEHGKPIKVLAVSDVMLGAPCYEMKFSDGSTIVSTADHVWAVTTKSRRKHSRSGLVRHTTAEIAAALKVSSKGESNFAIPACGPIQYEPAELVIDPYLLGAWLGDGTSRESCITSADEWIPLEIKRRGHDIYPAGPDLLYRVRGLHAHLRELNLLSNKHIPPVYLTASVSQRLDLLRGLMDTDGYVDARGRCEFTSTNRNLADGVVQLLVSLGMVARVIEGRATLNGKDCGPKYRVHFTATLCPFGLPRKAERRPGSSTRPARRFVVSCEPCPSVAVKCIVVDSPTHLFLASKSCIPTHNSMFAFAMGMAQALMRPRSVIWVTAPTNDHVSRVFDMIVEKLLELGLKDSCVIWRNTKDEKLIELSNGSRFYGVSLDSPISGAGTSVDLAIIDEAAYIPSSAWGRQILPTLADRNGCALIISSPETDDDWFWKQLRRAQNEEADGVWAGFRGPSWENFYMFPQGRKSATLKQIEGEYVDPREFLRRYGALPTGSAERVFPEYRQRVHVDSRVTYDDSRPVFLAIDPSAGASPYAVLVVQDYGDMVHVIDEYYERGVTTELVCSRLKERRWFDNVGLAVVDPAYEVEIGRWQMMGVPAVPVTIETKDHKEAIAKPTIEDTIPLVQRLLREPLRFYQATQRLRQEILEQLGVVGQPTEEQELELFYTLEERLSDPEMTEDDVAKMRDVSRIAIAPHCYNLQEEFTLYKRRPVGRGTPDVKEKPIDDHNHLLDALRYYAWMMKRSMLTEMGSNSYLVQQEPATYHGMTPGARNWLQAVRQRVDDSYSGGMVYLRES